MRPTKPVPKSAVITGAGGGIGRATAFRLAREGFSVACADLDAPRANATAEAIAGLGQMASAERLDVTDPGSVQALVDDLAADGPIGVLVNCAGIGVQATLLDTTLEDWQRILAVNLTGTFLMTKAVARVMVDGGHAGRIINIGSVNSHRGCAGRTAYGASKGGVAIFTKAAAVELAKYGITVNAVAPGPIETGMIKGMHTASTREAWSRTVPLGRYGEPEEIADGIAYLASDGAGYVTGTLLNVDGGWEGAGLIFEV